VNLPSPFHPWGEHFAIDLPGARAVFTTRRGGVSSGPYASLNLGRLTDDDPAAVERNRARLEAETGVPMAQIRQVHGTTVLRVSKATRPGTARSDPADPGRAEPPEADGQATATPGLAPLVLVADCLPIAVAGNGAVAMLHAGWRGLAGGVIAEGVGALCELGAGGGLAAAIGPGAGPCCYQVGEEVHAAFADHSDHNGHDDRFRRGRRNLDLKAIARAQLEQAGVATVHDLALCTICSDPALLFSHRRDHGITGRQGGLAWLT
jgi:purine-nucleoside/S-methyl-5'-thioadenosine phosphorylase / adenosine deaminase